MTGAVDICNRALSLISGRSSIAAMDEGSTESDQCSIHYESTRDAVLSAHRWDFARAQVTLGSLASPLDPWSYKYAVPSDLIKPRFLMPQGGTLTETGDYAGPHVPYILSGDKDGSGNDIVVILTNLYQAVLVYTKRVTVPDLWDNSFTDALVLALAAKICFPLTGDRSLSGAMATQARDGLAAARPQNANNAPTVHQPIPTWLRARGVGRTLAPSTDGEEFPSGWSGSL
jgi:hypothetical protein